LGMILTLLFIVSVFCQYSIHLAFLGHSYRVGHDML
jgi:hypothetical protein